MIPILPGEVAVAQPVLFPHVATVWTGDRFDTADRAALPCRFRPLNRQGARSGLDRADLARIREFWWPLDYAMPNEAQVEDSLGRRWNVSYASVVQTLTHFTADVESV